MTSVQVPGYFRDHVPWVQALADHYIATLGDAAPYPFLGSAMMALNEKLLRSSDLPLENALRYLRQCTRREWDAYGDGMAQ